MSDKIILFLEIIGAWLLFAGPLLQSIIELYRESDGFDHIREHLNEITRDENWPPQISFFWWLLPPVKIIRENRRNRKINKLIAAHLNEAELKQFREFSLKARAWILVAAGAWLVAIATTHNLTDTFGLNFGWWLAIILFLTYLSIVAVISSFRSKMPRKNRTFSARKKRFSRK